jgi:predicted nucleic acid-binding Zn ribbon protein
LTAKIFLEEISVRPMKKTKDSLAPLKEIITAIMTDTGLLFNPEHACIWEVWDEVVGKSISRNAQPLWIKNGCLRVKVTGPIWLQELGFMEKSIREQLNCKLGRKAVERIEFRVQTA